MIEGVHPEIVRTILDLSPLALPIITAFTCDVKHQMMRRDGYKCTVCGATEHLEASHLNHSKDNPLYNDLSNGFILCVWDHLRFHLKSEGKNGLSIQANRWAIEQLRKRLREIQEG